ncbi:hypothetical protein [Streptomyces achromogenes]|uniref:hypothetical protein n=1 Tax=Streptomyces achromogenes TaxID=67255 RepID=UPI003447CF77
MVSGIDAASLEAIKGFYDGIFQTTVPVSGPKVAEPAKLIENTFRLVNISSAASSLFFRCGGYPTTLRASHIGSTTYPVPLPPQPCPHGHKASPRTGDTKCSSVFPRPSSRTEAPPAPQ